MITQTMLVLLCSSAIFAVADAQSWAHRTLDNPLGQTHIAGGTGYDYQHNGSCGRMIALDESGSVHVVWTAGLFNFTRHVAYNRWDPQMEAFDPGGVTFVDQAYRAGFVTLAVSRAGCPLPVFLQILSSPAPSHSALSLCLDSTVGLSGDPATIIWPQIALSGDSIVQLITRESSNTDDPRGRIFYSRGRLLFTAGRITGIAWADFGGSQFLTVDTSAAISHTTAAARHSARTAYGWSSAVTDSAQWANWHNFDNDIWINTSEDAGSNWAVPRNVTAFTPPAIGCFDSTGDWRRCNRDTLRGYTDLSLVFDQNNLLHAAFTVVPFHYWRDGIAGPFTQAGAGMIYHWHERTGQLSLIADGRGEFECGLRMNLVCRPSLAVDAATGYLYCAYLRFDTLALSEAGFPNADVWISVSTDGGSRWSAGTNVTRTRPSILPAPAGQSLSEREPTLAEYVSDGLLHLAYVLDLDAGSLVHNEGAVTWNDFIYQRIPVDSIAALPLLPNYPLRWDSTGFAAAPPSASRLVPSGFILHPVYPNPFNIMVTIRFDLPRGADISLQVFDLLGRSVQILTAGPQAAGTHVLQWDAAGLASGIYFLSLQRQSERVTQKVILIR